MLLFLGRTKRPPLTRPAGAVVSKMGRAASAAVAAGESVPVGSVRKVLDHHAVAPGEPPKFTMPTDTLPSHYYGVE